MGLSVCSDSQSFGYGHKPIDDNNNIVRNSIAFIINDTGTKRSYKNNDDNIMKQMADKSRTKEEKKREEKMCAEMLCRNGAEQKIGSVE